MLRFHARFLPIRWDTSNDYFKKMSIVKHDWHLILQHEKLILLNKKLILPDEKLGFTE